MEIPARSLSRQGSRMRLGRYPAGGQPQAARLSVLLRAGLVLIDSLRRASQMVSRRSLTILKRLRESGERTWLAGSAYVPLISWRCAPLEPVDSKYAIPSMEWLKTRLICFVVVLGTAIRLSACSILIAGGSIESPTSAGNTSGRLVDRTNSFSSPHMSHSIALTGVTTQRHQLGVGQTYTVKVMCIVSMRYCAF